MLSEREVLVRVLMTRTPSCSSTTAYFTNRLDSTLGVSFSPVCASSSTLSSVAVPSKLPSVGSDRYDAWQKMAHQARNDYLHEELTAQEFLRKIDILDELGVHDAEKKMLPPPNRTYWRERIKMTYDFDPELEFSDVMQYMLQGTELFHALIPKENYISQARGGHESLREKYREGKET